MMMRRPTRRSLAILLEVAIAVVAFGVLALLVLAAPHAFGGGRVDHGFTWWVLYGIAFAGFVVGLVWIHRVTRSSADDDTSFWRSRRP
jgi:H+/Cl- antiporter ClcA